MKRKIISLFTLFSFIVFSISCSVTRIKEVKTVADWKGKKGKILSLVKTSGEHIEFSTQRPGRISDDSIVGTVIILNKDIEIDRANIERITVDQEGKILGITTKDKKIYHVITGTAREEEDKIILSAELFESVTIPLSDVKSVRVEIKKSYAKYLFGVGALIVACILYGAIMRGVAEGMKL